MSDADAKAKRKDQWEMQFEADEDEFAGSENEPPTSFGHSLCMKLPVIPVITAFETLLKMVAQDSASLDTPLHKKRYLLLALGEDIG